MPIDPLSSCSASDAGNPSNTGRNRTHILQLASASGGVIVDVEDGHVPENFKEGANNNKDRDNYSQTKLVQYPEFLKRTPAVHVLEKALPNGLVDSLYHVTANLESEKNGPGKPWGTYITVGQVQEFWKNHQTSNDLEGNSKESLRVNDREKLAVAAASYFFQNALEVSSQTKNTTISTTCTSYHPQNSDDNDNQNPTPLWTQDDQSTKAHGVAVWALASTEKSQVPYHLDYGEQIRYESNVIVPPLLAGTLQCTPTNMTGGDFCVCLDGLDHYERHGYKGLKSKQQQQQEQQQRQQQQQEMNGTTSENQYIDQQDFDYKKDVSAEWIQIPYKFNQMIFHSGHLPHLSSPVISMAPLEEHCTEGKPLKRVILGFNVFGFDYGPLVQQAPEHSDIFRRKVTLQRVINSRSQEERVSLDAIHANKGLSKLLVLAKREKVKRELVEAQRQLDRALVAYLLEHQQEKNGQVVVGVSVEKLMSALARKDGETWPSPIDVQVHINQRLSSAGLVPSLIEKENKSVTRQIKLLRSREADGNKLDRMVSPSDVVYLA